MSTEYFSDRERGPRPRTNLDLTIPARGGIVAQVDRRIVNGAFGVDFPLECPDGEGVIGTDARALGLAARGVIPDLEWPLRADHVPTTLLALDLVEFCFMHVAEPRHRNYHGFYSHHHLDFYREDGRSGFREDVNRVLARNQIAYELNESGRAIGLRPPFCAKPFLPQSSRLETTSWIELLGVAREKFLDPDPHARRHALEKLWDAFERLKTLETSGSKKASITALIGKAAPEPSFRGVIETEAESLTHVGNTFHIRHSERSQTDLGSEPAVDYLFHRLFALVWFLLHSRQ